MKNKNITYGQLEDVLRRLGYTPDASGNRVVFRQPKTDLPVILRRMTPKEVMKPIELLSVQNALANGGVVPKDEFDSLFESEPIELWRAIIDAKAAYERKHGHPPRVLKLPVSHGYELAKLRRDRRCIDLRAQPGQAVEGSLLTRSRIDKPFFG